MTNVRKFESELIEPRIKVIDSHTSIRANIVRDLSNGEIKVRSFFINTNKGTFKSYNLSKIRQHHKSGREYFKRFNKMYYLDEFEILR